MSHGGHHHHFHGRGYNSHPETSSKKPHKIMGFLLLFMAFGVLFRDLIWRPMIERPSGWGIVSGVTIVLFLLWFGFRKDPNRP